MEAFAFQPIPYARVNLEAPGIPTRKMLDADTDLSSVKSFTFYVLHKFPGECLQEIQQFAPLLFENFRTITVWFFFLG